MFNLSIMLSVLAKTFGSSVDPSCPCATYTPNVHHSLYIPDANCSVTIPSQTDPEPFAAASAGATGIPECWLLSQCLQVSGRADPACSGLAGPPALQQHE